MVNKCCVPACTSNYKKHTEQKEYVHTFLFPKDEELRERWRRIIPRENLTITNYTVVCEKHFDDSSIVRHDVIPGLNGKPDQTIIRKKLKLKEGAVPTIFPNLPSYFSKKKVPPPRECPDAKRRKLEQRDESVLFDFLESDKIVSFSSFKEQLSGFLSKLKEDILCVFKSDFVFLYKVDNSDIHGLVISLSIKICEDLSVNVWKDGIAIPEKDLKWIVKALKLSRWSELENLFSHHVNSINNDDGLFDQAIHILERVSGNKSDDSKCSFDFFIEQLKLLTVAPSRRRYSSQCIVFAFCLYFTSPSAYRKVRDAFLTLPNIRYLQHLCQNIPCERGLTDISFLEKEFACLGEKDVIVNLLIDEIHVKPRLGYRAEKFIGQASNAIECLANSIQCYMLSSVMTQSKIVVGMLPVKNMNSEFLLDATKNVIENCSKAGFNIVSIISDNNRINRKMFSMLTTGTESKFYITNPIDKERQIFLLFDHVHLLKSIRNNWLNVRNQTQTLSFPDFHNNETVCRASFSDLKTMYKVEQNELLKTAHTLTWKSLYPHSLERQKVSLALKIFNEANIAALKTVGPQRDDFISWEGTARFIELICHWWEMVNVQHRFYGRNKIKPHATPICNVDDPRLSWLIDLSVWLDQWNQRNKTSQEGFLSNDTYQAFSHTLQSFVLLIKYLLTNVNMEYVLTGKFQTDNLEGRFGKYRQLSGGNTLISVEEALQSEKKLRVTSLLKIHSQYKGDIPIREFLTDFSCEPLSQEYDQSFVSNFPFDEIKIESNSVNVIVYVAGYVAKKLLSKIDCTECCDVIGDKKKPLEVTVNAELLNYFDNLNRGGLIYPSNILFNVLQLAYSIMNVTVHLMEDKFLSLNNQKQTLVQVNKQSWLDSEFASEIFGKCEKCGKEFQSIFLMGLQTFLNILLNNYSKKSTESSRDLSSSIKKKVQKFN